MELLVNLLCNELIDNDDIFLFLPPIANNHFMRARLTMRKKDDNVYNKILFRSLCGFYSCREYRQPSNVG